MSTDPKPKRTPKPLTLGSDDVILPQSGQCRGLSPYDAKEQGYWGLIYRVTISYPSGNFRPQVYVGSRGFGSGWKSYVTSSDTVGPLITRAGVLGGPVIQWEILGYARSHSQALRFEQYHMDEARKEYGNRCLNKADVAGKKLGTQPNKYSKRKVKPQSNIRYT